MLFLGYPVYRYTNNSRVILVQRTTPETISQLHDQISNELPAFKGKWKFTFKIFRNNIYSIPPELVQTHESSPDTKYMYTLTPSYLNDCCVTLINKTSGGIFCNQVQEEGDSLAEFSISNDHLHKGVTTGLNDPFDVMTNQRLQSLWVQRQAIKGDGGQIYELENGNLIIRTSNVFLHGQFRGLLIQIEIDESCVNKNDSLLANFQKVIDKYNIPPGNLCCDVLDATRLQKYEDLALQYSEILNF